METTPYYSMMDDQALMTRPQGLSEVSADSPLNSPGSSGSTALEFEDKENVESDNASTTSQGSSTKASRRYSRSFGSSHKGKAEPKRWAPEEDERLRAAIDENGECNWKAIAKRVGSRTHVQCLQRWKKVLKPGLIKGQWGQDEDQMLTMLVQKGFKNWGHLAAHMPGRTSKQCRERWCHHLDPSINRGDYTKSEDDTILRLQRELGNRWADIASALDGRTENAVKSRWKALVRMQKTKRGHDSGVAEKMDEADDEASLCSGSPRPFKQQRQAAKRERAAVPDLTSLGITAQQPSTTVAPSQLTNAQRALLGLPMEPTPSSPSSAYAKAPAPSAAPYGFYSPLDQSSLLTSSAYRPAASAPAPSAARAPTGAGGGLLLLDPNNMRYDSSSCQAPSSTAYPPRYSTHGTYLPTTSHLYQSATTTTPTTSLDILNPSSSPATQASAPLYQASSTNGSNGYAQQPQQPPASFARDLSTQSRTSSTSWGWNLDPLMPDGTYSRVPSFNDPPPSSSGYSTTQAPQTVPSQPDLLSLLRSAPQPSRSGYFDPTTGSYDYIQPGSAATTSLPPSSALPLYTSAIPPPTSSLPTRAYDPTPSRAAYDSSSTQRQSYDSAPQSSAPTSSMPSRQSYSDFWYATHDMLSNPPQPDMTPAPATRQSSANSLDDVPHSRREASAATYSTASTAFPHQHLATAYLGSTEQQPSSADNVRRYASNGQANLMPSRLRPWDMQADNSQGANPFAY